MAPRKEPNQTAFEATEVNDVTMDESIHVPNVVGGEELDWAGALKESKERMKRTVVPTEVATESMAKMPPKVERERTDSMGDDEKWEPPTDLQQQVRDLQKRLEEVQSQIREESMDRSTAGDPENWIRNDDPFKGTQIPIRDDASDGGSWHVHSNHRGSKSSRKSSPTTNRSPHNTSIRKQSPLDASYRPEQQQQNTSNRTANVSYRPEKQQEDLSNRMAQVDLSDRQDGSKSSIRMDLPSPNLPSIPMMMPKTTPATDIDLSSIPDDDAWNGIATIADYQPDRDPTAI